MKLIRFDSVHIEFNPIPNITVFLDSKFLSVEYLFCNLQLYY